MKKTNKNVPINPPPYATMPISSISLGGLWEGGSSYCPNCDTVIKFKDNGLPFCRKCHYIYGTKNPRQILDEAQKCKECGQLIKTNKNG